MSRTPRVLWSHLDDTPSDPAAAVVGRTFGLRQLKDALTAAPVQLQIVRSLPDRALPSQRSRRVSRIRLSESTFAASGAPHRVRDRVKVETEVESLDGRSAKIRIVGGRRDGSVTVQLVGREPAGGLWTRAGVKVEHDHEISILPLAEPDAPLLAYVEQELEFG